MITIAICDSQTQIVSKYVSWIEYWEKKENLLCNVKIFSTTTQLLAHFLHISDLDILIIDPSIDNETGLRTVRRLRDLHCNADVMYFAPSNKYLSEAFETDLLFYSIKSALTLNLFGNFFLKAVNKRKAYQLSKVFSVPTGYSIIRIPYDSILYFEVKKRIVTITYDDKHLDFYAHLSDIEQQLEKTSFIRIHRSIVVNTNHVVTATAKSVTLSNGETLPVGLTYSRTLLKILARSPGSPPPRTSVRNSL